MVNIAEILKDAVWDRKEPAQSESIHRLIVDAGNDLPEDYLALLHHSDGGEGHLGLECGWFQLWSSAEVLELNKGYEIEQHLPGYFGFGSNGGGELLAFDTPKGMPWKVVMIPFLPMSENEAIVIAKDFEEFIRAIGRY
jgi:SMI1/KNR4 family protein SUKH-1